MTWNVLITDGLEKVGMDILREKVNPIDKKNIEADELLQIIGDYDALILRGRTKVTRKLMEAATRLKVVGRMGVGIDNIDVSAAKELGIHVVNCAVATSEAVAELALGMLFSLAREIPRADASMKAGKYAKKEFNGIELMGKTLGIVGFGNIGRLLGKYASALGMKVIAYDEFRDEGYIRANCAEPATLDELLSSADFISLHLPLTAGSKYMINDAAFAKMKDGVRIVDAARGGIIEEAALLRALESGKVAGAALDVCEKEPPEDWTLVQHPRVVATPHIGAQTVEAQTRAAVDISTEILNALEGKPLRWQIV